MMDELVSCGMNAESSNKEPLLGIKQQPWWPFIPLSNYMTPLLHCKIRIGNQESFERVQYNSLGIPKVVFQTTRSKWLPWRFWIDVKKMRKSIKRFCQP
jgi:hypothetical protein